MQTPLLDPDTEQRFHGMRVLHPELPGDPGENRGRKGPTVELTAVHCELLKSRLRLDPDLCHDPAQQFEEDVVLDAEGRIHVGIISEYPDQYILSAHTNGTVGWVSATCSRSGEEYGQLTANVADPAHTAWALDLVWDWVINAPWPTPHHGPIRPESAPEPPIGSVSITQAGTRLERFPRGWAIRADAGIAYHWDELHKAGVQRSWPSADEVPGGVMVRFHQSVFVEIREGFRTRG